MGNTPMNLVDWILTRLDDYGNIIFGLILGTFAHFGRLLLRGTPPTKLQALGFVMQLGLIGVAASVAIKWAGIEDGDYKTFATAVLAVSTQEVIEFFKQNGWQRMAGGITGGQAPPPPPTDDGAK